MQDEYHISTNRKCPICQNKLNAMQDRICLIIQQSLQIRGTYRYEYKKET